MVMAVELSAGPFIRSARPAIGGALYRPDQQTILTGKHGNAWSGPPVHPHPECRVRNSTLREKRRVFFGLRRPEVYLRHTPNKSGRDTELAICQRFDIYIKPAFITLVRLPETLS